MTETYQGNPSKSQKTKKKTPVTIYAGIILVIVLITVAFLYTGEISRSKINHTLTTRKIGTSTFGVTGTYNGTRKIAFVIPIFTNSAYHNAFYDFYHKHSSDHEEFVNMDLNYLTAKMHDDPHVYGWMTDLEKHTTQLLPNYQISAINDQDIQNGKIFDGKGNIAYDVLIFGHEEYVTQTMYDDLKKFVSQGGVLIFMDGNIFYAEVSYDDINKTITLVKGHGWEYNGTYAKRSIEERWLNETSEWVGSNYFSPLDTRYTYLNDPFNYSQVRDEDQYQTNHNIYPILDYEFNDGKHRVLTYWKPYGQGKVIVLGIYSQRVSTNPAFLKFFDELLLQYALNHVLE